MTKSYKLAALWMAAMISVSMLGCQNTDKPLQAAAQGSSTQAKQETGMDSQAALPEDGGSVQESEADKTESGDSNILITYFAVAENSDVDAASSASMVVAEGEAKGRMTYLAELIEEATGGDIFSIDTATVYPGNGEKLVDYAAEEQDRDGRPEILNHIENLEQYDIIFVGYPNMEQSFNCVLCA